MTLCIEKIDNVVHYNNDKYTDQQIPKYLCGVSNQCFYDVAMIFQNILEKTIGFDWKHFIDIYNNTNDTYYYKTFEIRYNINCNDNYLSVIIKSPEFIVKCKIIPSDNNHFIFFHYIKNKRVMIYYMNNKLNKGSVTRILIFLDTRVSSFNIF